MIRHSGRSDQDVALAIKSSVNERDDGRFRERPLTTRNQRRQLEKLAEHVERTVATDVAFFEKHPDRRYRVRRTSEAEIAQIEVVENRAMQPPEGLCWFTIVRKMPGGRIRVFTANYAEAKTGLEVPEDLAKAVFEHAAPSRAVEIASLVDDSRDVSVA
jgi:hypothetical protein